MVFRSANIRWNTHGGGALTILYQGRNDTKAMVLVELKGVLIRHSDCAHRRSSGGDGRVVDELAITVILRSHDQLFGRHHRPYSAFNPSLQTPRFASVTPFMDFLVRSREARAGPAC